MISVVAVAVAVAAPVLVVVLVVVVVVAVAVVLAPLHLVVVLLPQFRQCRHLMRTTMLAATPMGQEEEALTVMLDDREQLRLATAYHPNILCNNQDKISGDA